MALFKILKGLKNNLPSAKKDGYCYFTTDDQMFYIDYLDNNNVLQRKPLNANDAITLLGKGVIESLTNDNNNLPTSSAVYLETSKLQTAVDTKMDKNNPKGTGTFNFNTSGATGTNAVAFGGHAEGSNSFAFGSQSRATGNYSFAYGFNAKATGDFSYCEGRNNEASGSDSHAEGSQTLASAQGAHSEGRSTTASGNGSHAEGDDTIASGVSSHAEGNTTIASGWNSHTSGFGTTARTKSQFVIGEFNLLDSKTTAHSRGDYVFIVGKGTADDARSNAMTVDWSGNIHGANKLSHGGGHVVSADGAYAGGSSNTASGAYSHAEGAGTTASGQNSHAEGSQTQAIGVDSHAGGFKTIANKEASFAHGYEVQADAFSQAVFGKFNSSNTTDIFQIGGGSSDTDRFNAFSITPLGAAKIKSSLNIGGVEDTTGRANLLYVSGNGYIEDGVRAGSNYYPTENKDLVTKDYVVNNLPQLTHVYVSATMEGQASFDFSDKISSLENFYLVYFNGLLLIENVHYTVDGAMVNLLDWTARANDICHVVGLMPLNPDTNALLAGGV